MEATVERSYLIQVIKELLVLCENTKGKDNKAIVAANIMYVVGQYPVFLKTNWKFLKTVVKKLNEFMHEKHPGVQDMACETYLVIAKECKEEFSKCHNNEPSYIDTIINTLQGEMKDLEPHQKQMVYQSVGWMIKAIPTRTDQEVSLKRLMDVENNNWNNVLESAKSLGPDYLRDAVTIRQIDFFIRVNEAVVTSVGEVYSTYLQTVYSSMLDIYKFYSETISLQIQVLGPTAVNDGLIKILKVLRKNILKLFEIFMKNTNNLSLIASFFAPPLQELMLDYEKGVPDAR
jgi:exportin-1